MRMANEKAAGWVVVAGCGILLCFGLGYALGWTLAPDNPVEGCKVNHWKIRQLGKAEGYAQGYTEGKRAANEKWERKLAWEGHGKFYVDPHDGVIKFMLYRIQEEASSEGGEEEKEEGSSLPPPIEALVLSN